ncbi:MAG: hypothetical protein JWP97_5892 [Labilithrix sp.]|nr:hypothetical protein [Labilithrix sp.]
MMNHRALFRPLIVVGSLAVFAVLASGCAADATDSPGAAPDDEDSVAVQQANAEADALREDGEAAGEIDPADVDVSENIGEDTPEDLAASQDDASLGDDISTATTTQSVGNGKYRSDVEVHRSGKYVYTATITWEEMRKKQGDFNRIEIFLREILVKQGEATKAGASNMDFNVQIRSAPVRVPSKTWWSSGSHVDRDGRYRATVGGRSSTRFPKVIFERSDRPYVRFSVGKHGDGKKSIVFNVWPLEKG